MSTNAMANNSRSGQRTAGRGTSHLSNRSVHNVAPVVSAENVVIDQVVKAFGDARGQELDTRGHTAFIALWTRLYDEEKEIAVERIVGALVYELNQPVIIREAMLPWTKREDAHGLDISCEALRIKTGGTPRFKMDAIEAWEELNLYAKPWRARRWGTADDGIAIVLGWIADQQQMLVKSSPELREYLAKHPA